MLKMSAITVIHTVDAIALIRAAELARSQDGRDV